MHASSSAVHPDLAVAHSRIPITERPSLPEFCEFHPSTTSQLCRMLDYLDKTSSAFGECLTISVTSMPHVPNTGGFQQHFSEPSVSPRLLSPHHTLNIRFRYPGKGPLLGDDRTHQHSKQMALVSPRRKRFATRPPRLLDCRGRVIATRCTFLSFCLPSA